MSYVYPNGSAIDLKISEWSPTAAPTLVYIPWTREIEQFSPNDVYVSMLMPFGGYAQRLVAVQNSGTTFGGVCTVGFHIGADGAEPSPLAAEAGTLELNALDVADHVDFTEATRFEAQSRIGVSFQPTTGMTSAWLLATLSLAFDMDRS